MGNLIKFLFFLGLIYYVCWMLFFILLRVSAWIVFYWSISSCIALLCGIVAGLIIPFLVLNEKTATRAEIATPAEVVEQRVIKHPPRGFTRYAVWDRAWPVYYPYQALRDLLAVRTGIKVFLARVWKDAKKIIGRVEIDIYGGELMRFLRFLWSGFKIVIFLLRCAIVVVPFVGLLLGAWVAYAMWVMLMLVLGGAAYLVQQMCVLGYRSLDKAKLFRTKASVRCHKCYFTGPYPSYHCINTACGIIHRDVLPGPLGVFRRRCGCGETFPTTIGSASKVLVPACPSCGEELAHGSGARQTIQLPVFGAVGAGKTRLFAAALTAAEKQLVDANGALEPLDAEADGFLRASALAISEGRTTDKTIPTARPAGQPMILSDASGHVVELQLMDAAGESFANWHTTEELIYVNSAPTMAFVLDPLALPRINTELASNRDLPDAFAATGNQEDAYASVVDRLRSEDVKLSSRHLAVVITKTDILRMLPSGETIDPSSSDAVRDWLISQDQDGFVRRMESDFGDVRYFAVDSLLLRDPNDQLNPLHLIQWVFQTQKVAITLVPRPTPEPAAPALQPQKV